MWRTGFGRTQAISGVLVLLFISIHLGAFATTRWLDGLNTNFYWPASVMIGPPYTTFFGPYYFFGVMAIFVHIGCALRLFFIRASQHTAGWVGFWLTSAVGLCLALLINLMLRGTFFPIDLPLEWVTYLEKLIP